MRTRLKLDFWLTIVLVLLSLKAHAIQENLPDPETEARSTVEIEYASEALTPYRDRRSDWSFLFGFRYDNFIPASYRAYDSNTYKNLFGSNPVQLMGIETGTKYNMNWGSVSGELGYMQGKVSDSRIGDDVTLSLSKMSASFGIWLDTIWPEPYLVPYVKGEFFSIDFKESDSTQTDTGSSGLGTGYAAGVLMQLNWLDEKESLEALANSGLENAYLDFFVAQANSSSGSRDFGSEISWGAGFKVEY